jgi:hypothetical protein
MSNEVTVSLRADGLDEVARALQSMRDVVINNEHEATKAVIQGAQDRINAYRNEYREKTKLAREAKKNGDDLNKSLGTDGLNTRSALVGTNSSNFFSNSGSNNGLSSLFSGSNGLGDLAAKAGVAGAAFAAIKAGVDTAIDALKMFGSFLISDIIQPGFKLQTLAQQISNNSRGEISAAEVEKSSRAIGTKYNMDPIAVANGAADYGEATGNYKDAFNVAELLATIAKAYGGKYEEYSKLLSNLHKGDGSFQDDKNQLLSQIGQGQVEGGKFTIKQISNLGGKINEPAAHIAGDRDVSVASTTALIQLTGRTAGSVDESSTAVKEFINEIATNKSGKFKPILDNEGKISDTREALILSLVNTQGGRADKMKGAGFTTEGSRTVLAGYTDDFSKAMVGLPPTLENMHKAAEKATEGYDLIRNATGDEATLRNDASKVLATSGEKLDHAFNLLKDKLAGPVMDAADKFVDDFVKITPQLIEAAMTLAKALIWLAGVIQKIMNVFSDDGTRGGTNGYNQKGEYKMNFNTGKLEFQADKDNPYKTDKTTPITLYKPGMLNGATKDGQGNTVLNDEAIAAATAAAAKKAAEVTAAAEPVKNSFGINFSPVVLPVTSDASNSEPKENPVNPESITLATSLARLREQVNATAASYGDYNRNNPLK